MCDGAWYGGLVEKGLVDAIVGATDVAGVIQLSSDIWQ